MICAHSLLFPKENPLDVERKTMPEGKRFTLWFQGLLMRCKTKLERDALRNTIDQLWEQYKVCVKQESEQEMA